MSWVATAMVASAAIGYAGSTQASNKAAKAANEYNNQLAEYNRPKDTANQYGSTGYNDQGQYAFTLNSEMDAQNKQIQALKNAIFTNMMSSTTNPDASTKLWQDTYYKEAQRLNQPAYEQGMFARGLGGSSQYQSGLNDLLSKIGTQSILGAQQMKINDQTNTRANLTSALGAEANLQNAGNSLLELSLPNKSFNAPASTTGDSGLGALSSGLSGLAGYLNQNQSGSSGYVNPSLAPETSALLYAQPGVMGSYGATGGYGGYTDSLLNANAASNAATAGAFGV